MAGSPKKRTNTYTGLSITASVVECVVFSAKTFQVERALSFPTPSGVFSDDGETLLAPTPLISILNEMFTVLKLSNRTVNLSVPCHLLRLTEMPRLAESETLVYLSSEAERYKSFENTDAVVDFADVESSGVPANMRSVVFGALRKDTLEQYLDICRRAKIQVASIDFEELNILRAMAGTQVLDSLIEQIGADQYWGSLFVELEKIRFYLWQGNRLVQLREAQFYTGDIGMTDPSSLIISDLLEEIHRTTGGTTPAIWLTYNMQQETQSILSSRLDVPVRSCPVNPVVTEGYPSLRLAAIGAALRPTVDFPFNLDLKQTHRQLSKALSAGNAGKTGGSPFASAMSQVEMNLDPQTLNNLIATGVACMVLVVLGWVALAGLEVLQLAPQKAQLEAQKSSKTLSVSGMQSRLSALKAQNQVEASVGLVVKEVRTKNLLFSRLLQDLKFKTPPKIWLSSVEADQQVAITGKAMNNKAVLDFAKNFDTVPYLSSVLIRSIKELFIANHTVFDFSIQGQVRLIPELLEAASVEVDDSDSAQPKASQSGLGGKP